MCQGLSQARGGGGVRRVKKALADRKEVMYTLAKEKCMLKLLFMSVLVLSAFAGEIDKKKRGDITAIDHPNIKDRGRYVEIPTKSQEPRGKLIFSDSPEQVSESGILYRDDEIPAGQPVRVFVYHASKQGSRKFLVVLENPTAGQATVTISAKAIKRGATGNCVIVGKDAVYAWLESKLAKSVRALHISPGGFVLLDPDLNKPVPSGSMLNAIIDFNTTAKLRLSIVSLSPSAAIDSSSLKLLVGPSSPKSLKVIEPVPEHERGTFPVVDRMVTGDLVWQKNKSGEFLAPYIVLADEGQSLKGGIDFTCQRRAITSKGLIALNVDPSCFDKDTKDFKWKIDANGQRNGVELKGSYGVAYHVKINIPKPSDAPPQAFSAVLRAGGGPYAGAVVAASLSDDEKSKKVTYLPVPPPTTRPRDNLIRTQSDGIFIGKWTLKAPMTITFDWMPSGGSNLPVNIIFLPQ